MPNRISSIALSSLIIAGVTGTPATSQQAPSSKFVITKGKDTVGIELFSRDTATLWSEIHLATGLRWQITANLRADSSVDHIEATRLTRQGVSTGVSVHFGDTLVSATIMAPGGSEQAEVTTRGKAAPFLAISFALVEQLVQASHLGNGESAKWTVARLGAGDTATLTISRIHPDSALVSTTDVELRLALSKQGEILGGRYVGQEWMFERRKVR